MAKKLNAQAQRDDQQLTDAVRASARQIWQAGLGAFAKAQEEGGRAFSQLVRDGSELQARAGAQADDIGHQSDRPWDKLEQVFEERVARALASMGAPTREEVLALNRRLEELSRQVAELTEQAAGPPPP
ncbi:phasin family protein [Rugamonas sp.]|uniref:phasin family protein n=1 Tax=Rugamonas sp. TaxID=1926287 RepID=UPI0025E472FE|nr:phasin family protein [Rugamonas sp.]